MKLTEPFTQENLTTCLSLLLTKCGGTVRNKEMRKNFVLSTLCRDLPCKSYPCTVVQLMQKIADLKREFAEQLSEIGFLKSGISLRRMRQSQTSDGVLELTGEEANVNSSNVKVIRGKINNFNIAFHYVASSKTLHSGKQYCNYLFTSDDLYVA